MEYYYFGIGVQLVEILTNLIFQKDHCPSVIELSFNVDGLPLFKSSKKCFWPVLCTIKNIDNSYVFPVALSYGLSKPVNLDFLSETVNELKVLLQDGLIVQQKVVQVALHSIVCDAPARAMVKCIKLYSGYYGCDKCSQSGMWIGRIVYPQITDFTPRTNQTFREHKNKEHHHSTSPFCDLPIDMIQKFPIDYMHQVCLGVMKKLLLTWMRGSKTVRISAVQISEVSNRLIAMKPFIPRCFARKPRGLDEVDRWKATELRQFLLYTGKIALRNILPSRLFKSFLSFSSAISILISPTLCKLHCDLAEQMLSNFVKDCKVYYGEEFLVYNVHSLLHLADEAKVYGCLECCSAFCFENYLQKLKKMVRSGKSPLVQVVKRLQENKIFIPEKCMLPNILPRFQIMLTL
ncbi:uncharacterized protein LOC144746841 [Ciona intestinalis]